MNNQQKLFAFLEDTFGRKDILTVPRQYIDIAGSLPAALFLSQAIYWSDKTKRKDGFFYKSVKEWAGELGISEHQVRKARKELEEKGLITTKNIRANGAPTLHYQVDIGAVQDALIRLAEQQQIDVSKYDKSDLLEIDETDLLNLTKSITETTQRPPTETTTDTPTKTMAETISGIDIFMDDSFDDEKPVYGEPFVEKIEAVPSSNGSVNGKNHHNDMVDSEMGWMYPDNKSYDEGAGINIQHDILQAAKAKTFLLGEKERIHRIERAMGTKEVPGIGYVPGYPRFVKTMLKWASNKNSNGAALSVANILTAIEKQENLSRWLEDQNSKKHNGRRSPTRITPGRYGSLDE